MKWVAFNERTKKEFKCSCWDASYCLNQLPGEERRGEREKNEERRREKKEVLTLMSVPFDFGR